MDDRLHLFGIRHHGPGSAASLEQALDALDPEQVLIEGPPDADEILTLAAAQGMRPPVAILVHIADQPQSARFFPFAEFSPEWRAIQWALRHGRPVRFIDLPAAIDMAPAEEQPEAADEKDGGESPEDDDPAVPDEDGQDAAETPLRRDPLSLLAEAAGHSDGESWWNALVESQAQAPAVFDSIEEAMAALREAEDDDDGHDREAGWLAREARREAHMRLEIRKALKEGEGPVAVVTGAWHVPALRRKVAASEDKALLSGRRKVKTVATWIPWTDTRLAAASGYGAGVISPGWYRHLWREFQRGRDPSRMAARWQARAAEFLRAEGQVVATASVIEAARLAETLSALRGFAVPGLAEMQDASLAALCHGDHAPLQLIAHRLVLGERVGEIDESVPQMPLAADLARWQKRTRLKPEALERDISLDLRSEAGLLKSTLLHRLDIIDVTWGELTESGGGRGTFRERWRLVWGPELSVKLAEALVWGTTIEQAAGNAAIARVTESENITAVAEAVRQCLLADLSGPAERCISRLQALAVNASDVAGLMRAAAPLAAVLRYGTARRMPVEALTLLVTSLIEEVCVGLTYACRQLDAEAASAMRDAMAEFDKAVGLMEEARLAEDWQRALGIVADDAGAEPLLAGFAVRRLYDRGVLDGGTAAPYLSRALSPAVPPSAAGEWLDGFLAGAGQLLLHDATLLAVIDDWMLQLGEDDFVALLPMLRRGFSSIDSMERMRLLALIREGPKPAAAVAADDQGPSEAFERALPLLRTILGLEDAA